MAIAVLTLVGTGIATEVSSRAFRGDCAFPDAGDCRGVVRQVVGGGVGHMELGSLDGDLTQEAGVFQVAVGDGACRIGGGHNGVLDVEGKGLPPEVGLTSVVKEDTAHPSLGSIRGTIEGRSLGDDLGKVSWTVTQAGSKVGKGVDVGPKCSGDADTVPLGLGQSQLQGTEESC